MATIKSEYYRFTGSAWDLHYFKTTADLVVETATYKVLTSDERNRIAAAAQLADTNQRLEFGGSTQYIRLAFSTVSRGYLKHSSGNEQEIWTNGNFNPANYLPLIGGTITGNIAGTNAAFTGNLGAAAVYTPLLTSDSANIAFSETLDYVDFNSVVLRNVPGPTLSHHAANKEYVDNLVAEGVKPLLPVKCATLANIASLSGLVTIDGYQLLSGDRVLVKNQTTKSQNGIYAAYAGAWVKLTNSDKGYIVFVENGSTYNDWKFYCENISIEDVPQYNWNEYSKVDTISPGAGLTKSGTTIRVKNFTDDSEGGITNDMLAGSIAWTKLANTAAADNANASYDTWAEITAATTAKSLAAHLSMVMAAIGLLRGTTNYNTSNTQTIAGAYTAANSKIKSEIGANVPGTAGYVAGDLFFKTLSSS